MSGSGTHSTAELYHLPEFDPTHAAGRYQMPEMTPTRHVPSVLTGFNFAMNRPNYASGVHFFLDDYQFERVWRAPHRYIPVLSRFNCVLTPDFSLYSDMPIAVKIWNIYRSRLLGQFWQRAGLTVIPTVSWADAATFDFCFDGLPSGGTLAVSSVGICQSDKTKESFLSGFFTMLKHAKPQNILVYGKNIIPPSDVPGTQIFEYSSFARQKFTRGS